MKSRRKFSKEFKQTAVNRLNSGQSAAEVARALEVHPSDLHRWRRELQEQGERAFRGAGKKRAEETKVAELERKVGRNDALIQAAPLSAPVPCAAPSASGNHHPQLIHAR